MNGTPSKYVLTTEGTFASAAFRTVQVDGDIHLAPSQFDLSLQKHLTAKVFAKKGE